MQNAMVSFFHKFEIIYSIVISYAVYMMNNLFWFKVSSDVFFHNKSVFKNIVMTIFHRMIWAENSYISKSIFNSTFIKRVIFSRWHYSLSSFVPRNIALFKYFSFAWFSFFILIGTGLGTKLLFFPIFFGVIIFFRKFLFTNRTCFLIHSINYNIVSEAVWR